MTHVKRMLIACIVLLLLLLPVMAADAEVNVIDVFVTETAPALDAKPNENAWFVDHALSDVDIEGAPKAYAGFMWKEGTLYAAVQYDSAATITLTMGGKTAVYDVASAAFTTNELNASGSAAAKAAEFKLPISVSAYDQQIGFGVSVANAAGAASLPEGTVLAMRNDILRSADGCNDKSILNYRAGGQLGQYQKVTIAQGEGCYTFSGPAIKEITNGLRRDVDYGDNAIALEFTAKLNSLPVISAYEAWRGFCWDIRYGNQTYRMSLNKAADGTIYFNALTGEDTSYRVATTLKEGATVTVRVEIAEDTTAVLYLDGTKIADLPKLGPYTSENVSYFEYGVGHYNWVSGTTDVYFYGYTITEIVADDAEVEIDYAAAIEKLTFDAIKGFNATPDYISGDMNLLEELVVNNLGGTAPLTWTSSDEDVIATDGTVNAPVSGIVPVTLTAEIAEGVTKSFDVLVRGSTVDVYYTDTDVTLNGQAKEYTWFIDYRLSEADHENAPVVDTGYMWDENGLYVGLRHNGANEITLTLGEKTAVYDLASGEFTENELDAEAAASGSYVEFLMPLAVSSFDQMVDFDIAVSNASGTASLPEGSKLCMRSAVIFGADSCIDLGGAGYVKGSQYGTASNITITQEESAYHLNSVAKGTDTNGIRRNMDFPGGVADVEFAVKINSLPVIPTLKAWRGFCFEVRGTTELYRISLNKEADGTVYFNVLGADETYREATDLKEGDIAVFRIEYAADQSAKVYVNNEYLMEAPIAANGVDGSKTHTNCVELGIGHYNWTSGYTDVELFGYRVTRPIFKDETAISQAALNALTFDTIKGENTDPSDITSDLVLPEEIKFQQMAEFAVPLTWTSSRPDVIAADGTVTRPENGAAAVTVTATTADGQFKDFNLVVIGLNNDSSGKLVVVNDVNPAKGVGVASSEQMFTLDKSNNSLVLDQGESAVFNTVLLVDLDGMSRLNRESLTLWVSDDNATYTEITDYKLLQSGMNWYLYDFEAEGRYIKAHYTHFLGAKADFTAPLAVMIDAWYDDGAAPLANGGQWLDTDVILTNDTDTAWRDKAVVIPGIAGDASTRVLMNGETLFHYLDGEQIVARITDLKAGASAKITVLTGNDKAINIASKESVYEVTYGTRESLLVKNETGRWRADIPAGLKFPNGEVAPENMILGMADYQVHASFDGGYTWIEYGTIDESIHNEIYGTGDWGDGGFIIDDVTGRLFFQLHKYTGFNSYNMNASFCRNAVIYSDDGGKTWFLADILEADTVDGKTFNYVLSYNHGIRVMSTYDGAEGPGVDFIFNSGAQYNTSGAFCARVAYSCDGGMTWEYSKSLLVYGSANAFEGGVSECTFMERDDGVIVLYGRCQFSAIDNFAKFYSDDGGVTWYSNQDKDGDCNVYGDLSSIYTVNTQPIMQRWDFDGDQTYEAPLMFWGGNTVLGGSSYLRNPFSVAVSYDGLDTWRNIQNAFFETEMEIYNGDATHYITNPSVAQNGDQMSTDFMRYYQKDYVHLIAKGFGDWFYRTKGGYDTFENGTIHADGWVIVKGSADASRTQATDGKYSMWANAGSRVTRSIPYLQDGRIVLNVFNANSTFEIDLQAAYSNTASKATPAGITVTGGAIKFLGAAETSGLVLESGWNTLTFDMDLVTGEATLAVNDGEAVEMPLNLVVGDYICYLTIEASSGIFVDELLIESDLDAVIIGAAEKPDPDPVPVEVAGTTMTLGNDLALNFMVEKDAVTGEGWYAEIVHGDKVTTIDQIDWEESGDYVRIAYKGIAAKEMVDEVTITIYDADGNELTKKTDSARAYAMRMFGKSGDDFDTVLADMLNYGAAAQIQFNYKTDDLANSLMTEEQKAKATESIELSDIRKTASGYQGATLSLENNIVLNFFYSADFVGKTATVSYTDHYGVAHEYEAEVVASGSMGKVSVDKLVISDCSVEITVTIDGEAVVDSVESYCARMTTLALREPLMKFAASARDYFGK